VSSEPSLSAEQLEELLGVLRRQQSAIEQSLAASVEGARPVDLGLSIGRLTRVDALQHQHMAAERRRRLQVQLAQIRLAISNILQGTYGECARCEEPIGYARLRARPETPFCVRCQAGPADEA
jgi:DnaK suppressor protein